MVIREVKILLDLHVILDIFYRLKDHHKTKTDLDGSKTDHCSPAFTVIFGLHVWLGDYFNTAFSRYKRLMYHKLQYHLCIAVLEDKDTSIRTY